MIVIDPSVLLAILRKEQDGDALLEALRHAQGPLSISTASFVEAFIAAERRLVDPGGGRLLEGLAVELDIHPVPFDVTQMAWAVEAYERFGVGRGRRPAALNLGDCYSYGLAKALDAPLLFKGGDFGLTDVKVATPPY